MSEQLFNVWKEFRFDAAHRLDAGDDGDPRYRRVHGHSYQVEVWLRGPLTERGWVVDMGDLERRIGVARDALDHRMLNEVEGLGIPTMENIAAFVWKQLGDLPQLQRVVVKRGQSGEGCEYLGPG
ncbi:MAG: 6-carboxytetrahydropterin synthase QueD [Rhodanobacteraceae bacterium]|jgi:6-pyruvoyltetrahydropterin/6-carboxytetrahydropterin synthase|nr:MAG: 6-carboxytetrahydropterin synthase QueD [Rhodanobacteraceae bacterium]